MLTDDGALVITDNDFNIRDTINGPQYFIQTAHNKFIMVQDGGGGTPHIVDNSPNMLAWETFTLVRHGDDYVSSKTYNVHYLLAFNCGGNSMNSYCPRIEEWENLK